MEKASPEILLVLPCYNESEVLSATLKSLLSLLGEMSSDGIVSASSGILCVDDGSDDDTWEIIRAYSSRHSAVSGIRLARNCGQQAALMAGMIEAQNRCDAAITIDADLQDDPAVIPQMIAHFKEGAEMVYGVRNSRRTDSWIKRISARSFYRLRSLLMRENIYDHSDFRLMSASVLHRLAEYGESNLYLRGLMPQLSRKTAIVTYDRVARAAGETKYPTGRMFTLALDGITSFTSRPIRAIFVVGLIFLLLDIAVGIYVFISYYRGDSIQGWTSLMLSVWFLGSCMLMAIGVVGEYIGKIFIEVKHRPRWFISEKTERK